MSAIEVKICGIASLDDALIALDAGADYLGFVLYPKAPRGITADRLEASAAGLPEGARTVGVFVNESRQRVIDVARACRLHAAQLHGDERETDFHDMPLPIWRAVRLRGDACVPSPDGWPAVRYVIDAAVPGMYGGTGVEADWDRAGVVAVERPVMLAGGLTPDNVGDAIRKVRPLGVDTASGVETEPGRKDARKVYEFVAAAKNAVTQ